MYKVNCLNPIAAVGMDNLSGDYVKTDDFSEANVALVRSAAMHDLDLPDSLLAVARAGAGVNNIPLDKCAEKGIVVFNTPGANANGVKELVLESQDGSREQIRVSGENQWWYTGSGEVLIGEKDTYVTLRCEAYGESHAVQIPLPEEELP